SPHLILPPPLSPLQHPINYLRQQLGQSSSPSTAAPEFTSLTATSEAYSGIEIDRKGSTASRRSQNTLSVMDKFKFGLHPGGGSSGGDDNEDYEELVNKDSVGGGNVKKKVSRIIR
ncbi:1693_t:CDS:2, partial [Ambispora leptoticha]